MNEKENNIEINTYSVNNTELYNSIDQFISTLSYPYLSSEMRRDIPELSKEVMNITQEIGLSKRFIEEIQAWQESMTPKATTIENFNLLLVQTYNDKINIQKNIRDLILQFKHGYISHNNFCLEGETFLKQSSSIEPRFFAVSSSIKLHTDNAIKTITRDYGNNLSSEELCLLSTPLSTNYYTKRFLDTQKYLTNKSKENYLLLKRRYGKSFLESQWFQQQLANPDLYKKVENMEKERILKKFYFFLERKIPYAKVIDNLLTIDNIVEKFLQQNNLFLHDIFLGFLINNPDKDISEIKGIEEFSKYLKPSVKKVLSFY
jgi:hypothetical protein